MGLYRRPVKLFWARPPGKNKKSFACYPTFLISHALGDAPPPPHPALLIPVAASPLISLEVVIWPRQRQRGGRAIVRWPDRLIPSFPHHVGRAGGATSRVGKEKWRERLWIKSRHNPTHIAATERRWRSRWNPGGECHDFVWERVGQA